MYAQRIHRPNRHRDLHNLIRTEEPHILKELPMCFAVVIFSSWIFLEDETGRHEVSWIQTPLFGCVGVDLVGSELVDDAGLYFAC